jgi:hypothetical protein
LRITPVNVPKGVVAFAGVGSRIPIGVVLTRDGEVWTWGRVLGEHTPGNSALQFLAKLARRLHRNVDWGESQPVARKDIWQPNVEESSPGTKP